MQANKPSQMWINGCSGRMGQEIQSLLQREPQHPFVVAGGTNAHQGWKEFSAQRAHLDLVVDFSLPTGNRKILEELQKQHGGIRGVLVGTTGLDKKLLAEWKKFAEQDGLAVLMAPNTSLGISLSLKAALAILGPCVQNNFDIELSETHHRNKKDAPSGTALFLAHELAAEIPQAKIVSNRSGERQKHEIGIQASRGGGVGGEHQIRFLGDEEEISISHRAYSRGVFARGTLLLGSWLGMQKPGFYSLRDVDFSRS